MTSYLRLPPVHRLTAVFAVVVVMAGCAAVNPKPFQTFSDSLRTLGKAVHAQAQVDYEKTRADFLDRFIEAVEQDPAKVADLQFQWDGQNPYGFAYAGDFAGGEPLFIKLDRFQRGVKDLNDAMIGYADLLLTLAGDEVVNKADFDQLAKDLNAKTASASKTLKLNVPQEKRAFFSLAATKIFQQIIESKRKKKLRKAIEAQQERIVDFSELFRTAIGLAREGVKTRYNDEFPKKAQSAGSATGQAAKKAALENLLQVNRQTIETLRTLEALGNSYAALPAAHQALADAVGEQEGGLAGVLAFYNETASLHQLFTSLAEQE